MAKWQLQEAKAKFSEVVNTAAKKGPQIITRRGVDTAVVVAYSEWQKTRAKQMLESPKTVEALTREERQQSDGLLELLRSGPHFEIPPRGRLRMRKPVEF